MNERLPLASVALIAGAALANEILLTRFFAVIHWYHFAYMMISLALLGFGASGTLLALARRWLVDRYAPAFIANLVLFGLCALIGPLVAVTCVESAIVALPPFAIVPRLQVTGLTALQVPCDGVAEISVSPAGNVSVTTTFVAGDGPGFVTVIV